MPRRRFRPHALAATAVVATAGLLLAACGSSNSGSAGTTSTKTLQTLTVAVASDEVTPIANGIIQLAVAKHLYQKYGLNVQLVSLAGTPQVIQALVAGRADVANVDTSDAIDLEAKHLANVRAFVSNGAAPDYVVVARDSVNTFGQIKGTTFANETPGSEPDLMIKILLQRNHMSDSAISEVSIGSPADRLLAVVEGRAQTTIVSDAQWESLTAAQASCCHLLYNEAQFLRAVPVESKIDIAPVSVLKNKKQALTDFIEAMLSLSREYYKDPTLWADQVAQTRSDLQATTLAGHAKTTGFKDQWCINGCMNPTVLGSSATFFYNSSDLAGVPKIPVSAWTDTSLLKAVLAQMGVAKGTDAP